MIQRNVSKKDKIIRMLLAMALSGIVASSILPPTVGVAALILAMYFLITGFVRVCIVYKLIGYASEK